MVMHLRKIVGVTQAPRRPAQPQALPAGSLILQKRRAPLAQRPPLGVAPATEVLFLPQLLPDFTDQGSTVTLVSSPLILLIRDWNRLGMATFMMARIAAPTTTTIRIFMAMSR